MPGIISEQLFSVFDVNQNGHICFPEFSSGMTKLYTGNFDELITFIFQFYDFDKDGKISSEDVRIVLSYIPLNLMETKIVKHKGMALKS